MAEPSGRPELIFPLFTGLEVLDGVGPKTAKHFKALGVETPKDLLLTLPIGGIDRTRRATIREILPPAVVTVEVTIGAHRPSRGRGPYRIEVEDAATSFQLVFFHARGDYLERIAPPGSRRVVSGKVEFFDGIAQITHPDHLLPLEEAADIPAFEPVYPLASGITQRLMSKAVASALPRAPYLAEWIDLPLLRDKGWPNWPEALEAAHGPTSQADLSPETPARQRLAYDELFAHQLTLALARSRLRRQRGMETSGDGHLRRRVLEALPFTPTGAQARAFDEIATDMAAPQRMNRLVQGDVGAGKTLVALMALLTAVEAGGQGVMMAPTDDPGGAAFCRA